MFIAVFVFLLLLHLNDSTLAEKTKNKDDQQGLYIFKYVIGLYLWSQTALM